MKDEAQPSTPHPDPVQAQKAPGNPSKGESDLFVLDDVFPEAHPLFGFKPMRIEEIIRHALVVIDTNVLLLPYSFSKDALDDIRKVLTRLAGEHRLVVPGQVAREFAKHRPDKIAAVLEKLSQLRNRPPIQNESHPLLDGDDDYRQARKIAVEINNRFKEYQEAIDKVQEHISGWTWDDPVSVLYRGVFTKDVVEDIQFAPEMRGQIAARWRRHRAEKIPPGFEDERAGDLIIWHTILDLGRTRKADVVFVTQDEKRDWRHRGTSYPRFELTEEYRRASGGKTFQIIRFSDLLQRSNADTKTVQEVAQAEAQQSELEVKLHPRYVRIKGLKEAGLVLRDRLASAPHLDTVDARFLDLLAKLEHQYARCSEIEAEAKSIGTPSNRVQQVLAAEIQMTLQQLRRQNPTLAEEIGIGPVGLDLDAP